jgi:hypothetical protein
MPEFAGLFLDIKVNIEAHKNMHSEDLPKNHTAISISTSIATSYKLPDLNGLCINE